jgi:S1-C subfamily serine protease
MFSWRWRRILLARSGGLLLWAGIVSLSTGAFPSSAIASPTLPIARSPILSKQSNHNLSEAELKTLARSITVKVLVGRTWGSGILVHKQAQVYTVVTNQHVLNLGDRLSIQTADGRIHAAKVRRQEFGDRDLALLQFQARSNYAIASLERSSGVQVGDAVFAAGFPSTSEVNEVQSPKIENSPTKMQERTLVGFTLAPGQISLLPTKVLVGGYQIGATNHVRKGMSGGPLLNRQGKVVGINGMHAYPIWGDPFVYTDGSHPERRNTSLGESQHDVMVRSSWAIPIETFSKLFKTF